MKLNNNLLLINKFILFLQNSIEDDIDIEVFTDMMYNICNNLNVLLDDSWDEYLKKADEYNNDKVIKSYYFVLKRFQKHLFAFKDKIRSSNDLKLFDNLKYIIDNIQNRINLIRDNKFIIKSDKFSKQFINEEEYSLLLKDLDNEEK